MILFFVLLSLPLKCGIASGLSNSGRIEPFPRNIRFEPYLADPIQSRFKLSRISATDVSIPETSGTRWELKAGRTIGLVCLGNAWQVNLFGGFMAIFDVKEATDSIAWDGLFGAQLIQELSRQSTLKLGFSHQSAHRGDEYIERTGQGRIDYTRQEVNLAYSRYFARTVRTYLEGGWGTTLRNPVVQKAGRLKWGIEYGIPRSDDSKVLRENSGWFGALDLESMEELDWQYDSSLSTGYYVLKGNLLWRLGIEYRNGRVPYGEFFRNDESYVGMSIWNDFL